MSELRIATLIVMLLIAGSARADVLFVDDDAPIGGDGASWQSAYTHLADAIDHAVQDQTITEIRVGGGVYRPDQSDLDPDGTNDPAAHFRFVDGVAIRGGYLGLNSRPGQDPCSRDLNANMTVLSGDLGFNERQPCRCRRRRG